MKLSGSVQSPSLFAAFPILEFISVKPITVNLKDLLRFLFTTMLGSLFSRLLCVSLLLSLTGAYDCPLEECNYCSPAEIREAPGIGFELTTSYRSVLDPSTSLRH